MFENPRRGRQARNFYKKCSENSRSQIVFRTDIFRKLTLGAPEYTRKRVARAKLLFYLVKLLLFSLSRHRFILNFLLFTIRQKQNFFSANWIAPADSIRNVFRLIGCSFVWLGKLGERTGQLRRDNSRHVGTHENNSGETVRRLGTIIQSIFCAQSGSSIRLTVWKWSC